MEQVANKVCNSTFTISENGKIIAEFTPEEWKLVQTAIRNYNIKLQCSRSYYHKTKKELIRRFLIKLN